MDLMCLGFVGLMLLVVVVLLWRRRKVQKKNKEQGKFKRDVQDVKAKSIDYAIKISQGGRRLSLIEYQVRGNILDHELKEELHPIVTPPVEYIVEKEIPAGRHNIYLVSDHGGTCGLRPVSQQDVDRAKENNQQVRAVMLAAQLAREPMTPLVEDPLDKVELVEGKSVWEIFSNPYLSKKFIAADAFGNALGVMGSRMGLIIGLLVGAGVSAAAVSFIFIVLRLINVF